MRFTGLHLTDFRGARAVEIGFEPDMTRPDMPPRWQEIHNNLSPTKN